MLNRRCYAVLIQFWSVTLLSWQCEEHFCDSICYLHVTCVLLSLLIPVYDSWTHNFMDTVSTITRLRGVKSGNWILNLFSSYLNYCSNCYSLHWWKYMLNYSHANWLLSLYVYIYTHTHIYIYVCVYINIHTSNFYDNVHIAIWSSKRNFPEYQKRQIFTGNISESFAVDE